MFAFVGNANRNVIRDSYTVTRGAGAYTIQLGHDQSYWVLDNIQEEGTAGVFLRVDNDVTVNQLRMRTCRRAAKMVEMGTDAALNKSLIDNVEATAQTTDGLTLYNVDESTIRRWWSWTTALISANNVIETEVWVPVVSNLTISGQNIRNRFSQVGTSAYYEFGPSLSLSVGGAPDASAAITATSTTQGLLPPRMNTTQRDAISSPAEGLLIYNTTTNQLEFYNGSTWGAV
jgi:hypothetical protein